MLTIYLKLTLLQNSKLTIVSTITINVECPVVKSSNLILIKLNDTINSNN